MKFGIPSAALSALQDFSLLFWTLTTPDSSMTILHRYMVRRLCFASFMAIIGCCGPVTFVSVFSHLRSAAFYSELLLPTLYGLLPMILYNIMPLAVAAAITWCYGNYYREYTLAIMQAAGISLLSIRAPAIFVALGATAIGYSLSCFVAPNGARYVQDVLNVLQHAPNPSLLEPRTFYSLDNGRRLIYFHERLSKNHVTNVFLKEVSDSGEEYAFSAREAFFDRQQHESLIILLDGQMQVYTPTDKEVQTFDFKRTVRQTGLSGTAFPKRDWIGEFELGPLEFFNVTAEEDPAAARRWTSEAVKRFGTPLLALVHTIFGLGLLTILGDPIDRRRHMVPIIYCILLPVQLLFVIGAENVAQYGNGLAFGVVTAMVAEFSLGVLLMMRG